MKFDVMLAKVEPAPYTGRTLSGWVPGLYLPSQLFH